MLAKKLRDLKFKILATSGTAKVLRSNNIDVEFVRKASEKAPNIINALRGGRVDMVVNTPSGPQPYRDEISIRSTSVRLGIPCVTTISGARAAVNGIEAKIKDKYNVKAIQAYHKS